MKKLKRLVAYILLSPFIIIAACFIFLGFLFYYSVKIVSLPFVWALKILAPDWDDRYFGI